MLHRIQPRAEIGRCVKPMESSCRRTGATDGRRRQGSARHWRRSDFARLARRLGAQCAGLAINANGDPARFRASACRSSPTASRVSPARSPAFWRGWIMSPPSVPRRLPISSARPPTRLFCPRDLVARLSTGAGGGGRGHRRREIGRSRSSRRRAMAGGLARRTAARARGGGIAQGLCLHRPLSNTSRWSGRPSLTIRFSTSTGRRMWSAATAVGGSNKARINRRLLLQPFRRRQVLPAQESRIEQFRGVARAAVAEDRHDGVAGAEFAREADRARDIDAGRAAEQQPLLLGEVEDDRRAPRCPGSDRRRRSARRRDWR